jgi:hypothetical protein
MIDKVELLHMRKEAKQQLGFCCRTVMELGPVSRYITALEQLLFAEVAHKPERCEFTRDWVSELNDE